MNTSPDIIIKSPGRINLIGEHIDYNGGHVLPAAINLKVTLKFWKTDGHWCKIRSDQEGEFSIDLHQPIRKGKTQWENYLKGVLYGFLSISREKIKGFECSISSELPIGAGISSSAALECGFAQGINTLFNLQITDRTIIDISQKAEHHFVGTKCGIMDQFAVMTGEKNKLILLHCETLEYRLIEANIFPYSLVLINSNVSHNLASSEYNKRREECNEALALIQQKYPEYKFLSDVPVRIIHEMQESLQETLFKRALYVSQENSRTLQVADHIQKKNIKEVGTLMYQTHQGLSQDYQVSCPEIDFLVDFTKDYPQVVGSRMMGGGFGGCTINLIEHQYVDQFIPLITEAYKNTFNLNATPIQVDISNGVEAIKP
ncbi:MAG: galactokinase [Flavobacteriaceae bacterium]